MARLNDIYHRMQSEWRQINIHWQSATNDWHDAAQERFERDFWQTYESTLPVFFKEVERLAETIEKARREVS